MKYCGREFDDHALAQIRRIIAEEPPRSRAAISRQICEAFDWRRADGGLKEMSCRVALLRMETDGWIRLPAPRNGNNNGRRYLRRTQAADPGAPVCAPAGELPDLRLELVVSRDDSHLWNEYVERYHYLGYQPLPGAQLRYFARSQGRGLALLGFGAAAWKAAPRDAFIGWTPAQRTERLHLVVNNARFLILPWVSSRNLASKLLGMAAARIASDWEARYGYEPVLLETFVEKQRFAGTCYRAANWQLLGETKGRGKLDTHKLALLPIKTIWTLPLSRRFRRALCE